MPRKHQLVTASDEQIRRFDEVAVLLGVEREEFDQTSDDADSVSSFLSHAENRELGRLAYDLETSIAALVRGMIRGRMKEIRALQKTWKAAS